MIGLRKNGYWLDLEPDFKLKLQMNNPLVQQDAIKGEYSFPFRIPASATNLLAFGFGSLPQTRDVMSDTDFLDIYYSGLVLFAQAKIHINYQGKNYIDMNVVVDSGLISAIKDIKLKELDWGDDIEVSSTYQFQTIQFPGAVWVTGSVIQLVIVGYGQFLEWIGTSINGALNNLKAQIDAATFFDNKTIACVVVGDQITLTATWVGLNPVLYFFVNTQPGLYYNIIAESGNTWFPAEWAAHQQDALDNPYPARDYIYFPVRNENSLLQISYTPSDIILRPYFDVLYQNFYSAVDGVFRTNYINEIPGTPPVWQGGLITPFMYVASVLDKIAAIFGKKSTGFFHGNAISPMVLYSNVVVDLLKSNSYADSIFTTIFNLRNTLPDVTIEEFITALRNTFFVGINTVERGAKINVVTLSSILTESEIIDWSNKVTRDVIIYAESVAKGFFLDYDREENDLNSLNQKEALENWEFLGSFNNVADFPVVNSSTGSGITFYAFAIDESKIYKRHLPPSTFTWIWQEVTTLNAPFTIGEEEGKEEILVADPLYTYNDREDIEGVGEWKVPLCNQPISMNSMNQHKAKTKKVRFLSYLGMQPNSNSDLYPMGSSDGTNIEGTSIEYDTKLTGEESLYNNLGKEWLNFLMNTRKVEIPVNLNILDLFSLDWSKRIHIHGSNYILYDMQPQIPFADKTLCTFLKIV